MKLLQLINKYKVLSSMLSLWTVFFLVAFTFNHVFTQTIQIGSGNLAVGMTSSSIPLPNYHYAYSQQIVKASEYNAGNGVAGAITKIRYQFPNIGSSQTVYGDWDLYIGHTQKSKFNSNFDWVPVTELTQVFSGNIHELAKPPTNGQWFEIEFSTPFLYNGTDNIVVAVNEKTPSYVSSGLSMLSYNSSPYTGIIVRRDSGIGPYDPTDIGVAFARTNVLPQLQFEGIMAPCSGTPLAGLVNLNPMSANANSMYQVRANGYSVGANLTYTWEKSTDDGANWTEEYSSSAYAHLSNQEAQGTQGTHVKYRLKVACGTDDPVISDTATFTTSKTYCVPLYSTTSTSTFIKSFKTTNAQMDVEKVTDARSPNGYGNFTEENIVKVYPTTLFNFETSMQGSTGLAIWIDWNDNGTFEADERVFGTTTTATTASGQIVVPGTQGIGTYRMRVVCQTIANIQNPCYVGNTAGEVEDYTIEVLTMPACTEPPTAPTIALSKNTANAGDIFTISATDYDFGTDMTFTWQKSTDNGANWETIGTASPYYYDPGEQTAPEGIGTVVQYRLLVACGSGVPVPSDVKTFTTGKIYCTPTTTISTDFTVKFTTTGGITNANYTTDVNGANPGAYINLSADANYTITRVQGQPLNFEHQYKGGNHHVRIWIDWNNNGTFSDDEEVFYHHHDNGNVPWFGSYTIPLTTDAGSYRMRVRSQYKFTNPNSSLGLTPCGALDYGTTLDFTLVVQETVACTGEPAPGTANAVPPTANAGSTYSVVAADYTIGSGLTYQWLKYNETLSDWEEHGTATSEYADLTEEIAPAGIVGTEVKYRLKTTCNNSGDVNESTVATFTTGKIYCTPNFTGTNAFGGYIKSFKTTDAQTDAENITDARSTNGYGDFTATHTVKAYRGSDFNFNATMQSTNGFALWIDWNNNGTFEADERLFNTTSYVGTFSGTISVPNTQATGLYRIRILCDYSSSNPNNPCYSGANSGEAEDYTLEVLLPPACTEPPTAPSIALSKNTANAGDIFTISATNYDLATDLTFTWQQSTDNGANWETIGTASPYYYDPGEQTAPEGIGTVVQYRLLVACGAGDPVPSNVETFTTGKIYCTPVLFPGTLYYISEFSTTGAQTNIVNNTGNASPGGYGDFSASHIIKAYPGMTFNFNAVVQGTTGKSIWIDWNDNGTFEANERIHTWPSENSNVAGTIYVDPSQELKQYRLRMAARSFTSNPDAPCHNTGVGSGEFEDYTIEVILPPACTEPPTAPDITLSKNTANAGDIFTISATNYDFGTDMTFTWQKSLDNGANWLPIGTASPYYYDPGEQTAPEDIGTVVQYRLLVACGAGVPVPSNVETFTTGKVYCEPNYTGTNTTSYYIKSVKTEGGVIDIDNTTDARSTNGYGDFTATHILKMYQGTDVQFTVECQSTVGFSIWVDWNDNGTFENSEYAYSATAIATSHSGMLSVLVTQAIGTYRMRMMVRSGTLVDDPCYTNLNSAFEAEDYILEVLALPACPDPITIGDISITPPATNGGATYSVTASSYPAATGLTFQWEKSTDGGTTWTNAGLTTVFYAPLENQTAPLIVGSTVQHRLKVYCDPLSPSYSNVETFTTSAIYCTPNFTGTTMTAGFIKQVKTIGAVVDIDNLTDARSQNGYGDFTADANKQITALANSSFNVDVALPGGSGFSMWIDWNKNGIFESNELLANVNLGITAYVGTVVVPFVANGEYRMRLLCNNSTLNILDPCYNGTNNGEVEDYLIKVIDLLPCIGTPSAGNLSVNPITANVGEPYVVTSSGYTVASGLTFTWYKWGVGATDWEVGTPSESYALYNGTAPAGLGSIEKYKLHVSCNAGGDHYSDEAEFKTGKIYCTPSMTGSSGYIQQVKSTGAVVNINDSTMTKNTLGYTDNSASQIIRTTKNTTFDVYVKTYSTNGIAIWIDWNDNGIFESDERVYNTTSYQGSITATITVDADQDPGIYRMRVHCNYGSVNPTAPCLQTTSSGEFEDYSIEVIELSDCASSGMPNAGQIIFAPPSANENATYEVNAIGNTFGTGYSYIWQKSIDGGNTWTEEYNETEFLGISGQIAPLYGDSVLWLFKVACASDTAVSDTAKFKSHNIHCTPYFSGTLGYIKSFKTIDAQTNVENITNALSTGGYGDFTATHTVKAYPSMSFQIEASLQSTNGVAIWVDWNNNGLFEATERMYHTTNYTSNATGTISVPNTQAIGLYRMRVLCNWSATNPNDPCYSGTNSGEVEDYTLEVVPLPECSSLIVTAGMVNIDPISANGGTPLNVTASGYTYASGLTYTWEKLPDGATTWEVLGTPSQWYYAIDEQTASYEVGTTVKYRLTLACNNTPQDSDEATFTTHKIYCTPSFTTDVTTSGYINSVKTTNAVANFDNQTDERSADGYGDFTTTHTANVYPSMTVDLQVNVMGTFNGVAVWIDWDDNGTFEENERVYVHPTSNLGTVTIPIIVPGTQAVGTYRMRVMSRGSVQNINTPCYTGTANGEAEDYTLEVIALPTCTGTPSIGALTVTPNTANGGTLYNVTVADYPIGANMNFQWEKSLNGGTTWENEGTATAYYTSLIGQVAPPFGDSVIYRLKVACGTDTTTSDTAMFKTGKIYCTPVYTSTTEYTAKFETTGGIFNINANYLATSQTGTQGYNNLSNDPNYLIARLPFETVDFTHTFSSSTYTVRIWVDWNNNGIFEEDEDEEVYNNHSSLATQTGSFDIPVGIPVGDYRMRMRSRYSTTVPGACSSELWGQALDFTLRIMECTTDAGTIEQGDADLCLGLSMQLTSTQTNGTAVWKSNHPDTVTIDPSTGIVSGMLPGTAEIVYVLTAPNGCIDSTKANITVKESYPVNITDWVDTLYVIDGVGQEYDVVSDGISGSWNSTNAFIASVDATTGHVKALMAGQTNIIYSENHVCSISAVKQLTVIDSVKSKNPGEEPPGNNSVEDIDAISNVSLFPNPATNTATIQFTLLTTESINVEIVDLNGKVIETIALNDVVSGKNTTTLNVENYASGIYSVVLRSNNAFTTQKLVIQK